MHSIILRTERLLLRPSVGTDANAIFEWVSDERVSRYMVYSTYKTVEQVREWLALIEYARKNFGATHFISSHAEPNLASGKVMEKCGLQFAQYGKFQKLDGSCKMRSMVYKAEFAIK